jgi:hypothetical protein
MALNARVEKDGGWGVKLLEDDTPILLVDADTAIKLGIHLIILGQDALHGRAFELVCIDKNLPPDTFIDMWSRIDQYISILNANQKDVDGEDV